MQRKGNKQIAGVQAICNSAAQTKIEDDYEKARLKIEAQMDHIKRFEDLVSMKITAEYCPGCKKFLNCYNMRLLQKFSKRGCYPSGDPFSGFGEKLFATFAKGITLVEDLKPVTETFSGN